MTVRLRRCREPGVPISGLPGHACRRVEEALEEQGIDYERVPVVSRPHSARDGQHRLTGQYAAPVIEFDDGSPYRSESTENAATIPTGKRFAKSRPDVAPTND